MKMVQEYVNLMMVSDESILKLEWNGNPNEVCMISEKVKKILIIWLKCNNNQNSTLARKGHAIVWGSISVA